MISIRLTNSLLVLFMLVACQASAGPLRDKLTEQLAAHQEEGVAENGDAEAGAASLPAGVKLLRDVAYGSEALQSVDVYIPPQARNAPMIVMVHGGAWFLGDKKSSTVVENKVARWVPKGFIFVSVNYRMLPALDALGQSKDVARALAFVQSQATAWGGDASRLILMGHSAGAHLVSLLAANPAQAYELGVKLWLGTVSLDSAALDVVKVMESSHPRFYDRAFGRDQANWKLASPAHVLTNKATPLLAVCSTQRKDHPCIQAGEYVKKAGELGVKAGMLEQNLSHKDINKNLGLSGAYTDAVEKFMGSLDPSIKAVFR
jgi:acetyl esterase/lipase